MSRDEHSPAPPTASNPAELRAWTRLGQACRLAAWGEARSSERVEAILALAADALGAERAYLATPGDHEASIEAMHCARDDGQTRPSRSLLRHALDTDDPVSWLTDALGDVSPEASVRSLALRSALMASVPLGRGRRAALLLDSRGAPVPVGKDGLAEVVPAFAALLAITLEGVAARPGRAQATPAVRPHLPAGRSEAYRRMLDWVQCVARSELPVLIHGESGSGKEAVSRAVHGLSARRDGPFVPLNCSALTETLLEAELFGAVRGAYTGADRDRPGLFRLADGGTLFLDEVGDMPASMQAKLLRTLEDGSVRAVGAAVEQRVDVRVVAASHRDLERLVVHGGFRQDLYHRLGVLRVEVPPLRDRLDELPLLVDELSGRLARETGHGPPRLTEDAWKRLRAHDWPGNVRELHAVLARALLRSGGGVIDGHHLGALEPSGGTLPGPAGRGSLERAMIESALRATGGSIARAASRIGWSRQKLYRRIEALDVRRPRAGCQASEAGSTSSASSTFQ